jgi:streptogramin lyase
MAGAAITLGPDHDLWFTEGMPDNPVGDGVGRLTPPSTLDAFPVCGMPFAITSGPDGNLWYTTGANNVGRVTRAGQVTVLATNDSAVLSQWAIASSSNGRYVWVIQENGTIARITAP